MPFRRALLAKISRLAAVLEEIAAWRSHKPTGDALVLVEIAEDALNLEDERTTIDASNVGN